MGRPTNAQTSGYSSNNSNKNAPAEAWVNLTLIINGEEYQLPVGIPVDPSKCRGNKQKAITQLLLDKAKEVTEAGEETYELKVDTKVILRPTPQESDAPADTGLTTASI